MFGAWWRKLVQRPLHSVKPRGRGNRGPHSRSRVLCLESLEGRSLPSVSLTLATPTNRTDIVPGILDSGPGPAPIEPTVSVNPVNPSQLIVSSQKGQRVSQNGGSTFTPGFTREFPLAGAAGNSGTVFTAQGQLFWTNVDATNPDFPGVAITQLNPADGTQLGSTRIVSSPPAGSKDDKPFLAAGRNVSNPSSDSLYVVWTRFDVNNTPAVLLSRSTDQGTTWSAPVTVSAAGEGFSVWPATVAVGPSGEVFVAYHAGPLHSTGNAGKTYVARYNNDLSSQLAKTLAFGEGASDVTANVQTAPRKIPGTQFWTQGSFQPWVVADPNPMRANHLYVITTDDPGNGSGTGDLANVVLARSTNNGATWTTSTLEAGPNNSFQLFPAAAIDRFGNLVVAWYDNRRGLTNSAGRYLLDVFAKYSLDGGTTWSSSFQVNDTAFDPDPGADKRLDGPPQTTRIGEYLGLSVFGGTAYVAWNGNTFSGTTPIDQQVYVDTFALAGTLTINGDDNPSLPNDNITLQQMAGNPGLLEVYVNGQRQYAGSVAALSSITVNSGNGDDNLGVYFSNGNPTPSGGLTFDGGPGTDSFYIHGTSGNNAFVQSGSQVTLAGAPLNYTATVEWVNAIGLEGDDSYTISATATGAVFYFDGGPGTDSYHLLGTTGADAFVRDVNERVTRAGLITNFNPTTVEWVTTYGFEGDDSFTIQATGPGPVFNFEGGPGTDSYYAYGTSPGNDAFVRDLNERVVRAGLIMNYDTTVEWFTAFGFDGDDTFTVQATGPGPVFNFVGGTGTDSYYLYGTTGADVFSRDLNERVTRAGLIMNFDPATVENVTAQGFDGNDSLTVYAYNVVTTLTFDGGFGTDSLTLVNPPSPTTRSGTGTGSYTLPSPYKPINFIGVETFNP